MPWTTVCEALSALGKAVAKGKRAEAKAKSKLDAKKSRNEGPQQRTLLQTLSRATKMKNGPTASSARLLQDIVPSSILQHIFVVGSLSPIDLCSARASCIAWRNAISEKDFMRYTMTSMREPGDILRIATELELFSHSTEPPSQDETASDAVPKSLRAVIAWCKSAWWPKQQRCGRSGRREARRAPESRCPPPPAAQQQADGVSRLARRQ